MLFPRPTSKKNRFAGLFADFARSPTTMAAQVASLSINCLTVTRGSNLVAEFISGTGLNLKTITAGSINISVDKDPDAGVNGQDSLLISVSTMRSITLAVNFFLCLAVTRLSGSICSLPEIGKTTEQGNDFKL